jgi:hypothetical protein
VRRGTTLLLALGALFAVGGDCRSPAQGKLGNAEFSSPECGAFCQLPVYASGGATDVIHVTMKSHGCSTPSWSTASSTNASVASFSRTGSDVAVKSGISGMTDLQLLDDKGQEVDAITISVHDIARYTTSAQSPVALVEAVDAHLDYSALDAMGGELADTGATVIGLGGTLAADAPASSGEHGPRFHGTVGSGFVTLAANAAAGIAVQVDVDVVPLAQVATIAISDSDAPSARASFVTAVPKLADGRTLYGAECAWTTSDSSVTLYSSAMQGRPVDLDGQPNSLAEFRFAQHGTFSVTCTIGGASATTNVSD